jgi:hypothetical protein
MDQKNGESMIYELAGVTLSRSSSAPGAQDEAEAAAFPDVLRCSQPTSPGPKHSQRSRVLVLSNA